MVKSAFGWPCTMCIAVVLMSNGVRALGVLGARNRNNGFNFTTSTSSKVVPEHQGLVPALVVFGDSTVDASNNNYLPTPMKSNFPPYGMNYEGAGRFTDGLLATDIMSLKLGIPFQLPYLSPKAHGEAILTGVNFTSSASGWFEGTDNIWGRYMLRIP